jgi:hypothetical protein
VQVDAAGRLTGEIFGGKLGRPENLSLLLGLKPDDLIPEFIDISHIFRKQPGNPSLAVVDTNGNPVVAITIEVKRLENHVDQVGSFVSSCDWYNGL